MSSYNLITIVEKLRNEHTRWDAILELKLLQNPEDIPLLINLLSDDDWIVRWSVAEKLGDFRDPKAIKPLAALLADPDAHVRKNAFKSLAKYLDRAVPLIVYQLENKDPDTRKSVCELIRELNEAAIPAIEKVIFAQNSIVASRLIHLVWEIGGPIAEKTLIRLLDLPMLQKQLIILLGSIKSRNCLQKLIHLYSNVKLRRVILLTFKSVEKTYFYDFIARIYLYGNKNEENTAKEIILKIGDPFVHYLASIIAYELKHTERIINLMILISPKSTLDALKKTKISNSDLRSVVTKVLQKNASIKEMKGVESTGLLGFIDRLLQ